MKDPNDKEEFSCCLFDIVIIAALIMFVIAIVFCMIFGQ